MGRPRCELPIFFFFSCLSSPDHGDFYLAPRFGGIAQSKYLLGKSTLSPASPQQTGKKPPEMF